MVPESDELLTKTNPHENIELSNTDTDTTEDITERDI